MALFSAEDLERFVRDVFETVGLSGGAAALVADSLIAADLEGVSSHGVMLVPLYVDRILAGSVSLRKEGTVIADKGTAVVLDAENALGQVTSRQAVEILIDRVRAHGLASVVVRNAFHFGAAGHWARQLADAGLIGIAMSNTRPLMPAPGGAERVVGNNPLAIALPSAAGDAVVLDMAMSATAMGKIRLAASKGVPIPEGWATDAEGRPTTDAYEAIKGMLLPAAGPKGFGLAFMIDVLCGGLSGGGIAGEVRPLYGDHDQPYNCSHFFMGLDPAHFGDPAHFAGRVDAFADIIRKSKPAQGTPRTYAPGDPNRENFRSNGHNCPLADETLVALSEAAERVGCRSRLINTQ